MKILVTGGAGFIGSHVADLLCASGHDVCIVDDLSTGKKENVPAAARFYQVSITETGVYEVFEKEKPGVVMHLAAHASVPASVKNPFKDMDINIRGTLNILEASVKHGVKKVVFSSTGGAIYGEQDYFPADENHPFRPLSPYGISKLSAEKYLYAYYKNYGLNYFVLRYSNVYGPRQDPFGEGGVVAIFIMRFLKNEQPVINGTGDQTRDFVYVKDVARANLLAMNSPLTGAVNIGTGREVTVNETFRMIKDITGSGLSEKHGPALPGEQMRSVLSFERARQDLCWEPLFSFEDGLKETAAFFKSFSR